MAVSVAVPSVASATRDSSQPGGVPWVLYPVLASSAAIVVGLIWDISWHRTVGRDTFWSPPHVLEQLAAIVTGLSCGWLVLRTTFAGSDADRASSVRFWGFRGPLGAWICIWGTLMTISSAPFDNWWHNAYGLDVKIISPPHTVLASGMIAIQVGAMILAVAAQNRAAAAEKRRLGFMYAISAGILVSMVATVIMEDASLGNHMHGSQFYRMTAVVFPIFLVAAARASRLRWPATVTALVYMAIQLIMIWTLQLFPAQPKLAPIYNPVTHMVPPGFPLLLVAPAFVIDLLMRRSDRWNDWGLAAAIGAAFVGVMIAVHWYWAEFLLSPAARNFFFAADNWSYDARPGPWRYEYWTTWGQGAPDQGRAFLSGLGAAALAASVSARVGLWFGNGMARVKR